MKRRVVHSMEEVKSISVIICTRNRADSLKDCLDHFRKIEIPRDLQLELIVVDNNSIDDTAKVVREFSTHTRFPVLYAHETRKGLGFARNTGYEASSSGIIAFTDDDCFVDPHWLHCIMKEFDSDPELSGIGGRVELFDMRDKPVTILTSRERRVFTSADQIFSFIHGCNMAFDRRVFQKIGLFDSKFGAGTKIASAEDSDFIYRVHKGGFKMAYCPDVCVYHNHGRRTDLQVTRLMKGYVIGRGAFYCKYILHKDLDILKISYWEISALLRNTRRNLRSRESRTNAINYLWDLLVGAFYYLLYASISALPIQLKAH